MTSHTIERRKHDHTLSIKDSWNGVTEQLLSFWKEISSSTFVDSIPFYEAMWDTSHFLAENFLKNTLYWSNLIAHSNPFLSGSVNIWKQILQTYYQLPAWVKLLDDFILQSSIYLWVQKMYLRQIYQN